VQPKLSIAIAGAGPAGLAAALYLHRAGHRITIFERFENPAPVGSGLILQPTGLTVLDNLGLLGDIMALGSRIDRLHGTDARSGRTVLDVRYRALPGGRFGVAVHRAALFGVLYRAVLREGIAIETGVEIDSLDAGEAATLIDDKARGLGSFDLVIDASGTRSRLRRHADVPGEPHPLAYGAFWASLRWHGDGFDEHALLQRYDRTGRRADGGVFLEPEAGRRGPRSERGH
jgi:2-polyprenyl-6-methoxyphenol hydroxylase-like FAD-dependent oxidoreductase